MVNKEHMDTNCTLKDTATSIGSIKVSAIKSKVQTKVNKQLKNSEPETIMFKNLLFEIPVLSLLKRKLNGPDDDHGENHHKRIKDQGDSEEDDQDDVKIFNYMTGAYESIKKTTMVVNALPIRTQEVKEELIDLEEESPSLENISNLSCNIIELSDSESHTPPDTTKGKEAGLNALGNSELSETVDLTDGSELESLPPQNGYVVETMETLDLTCTNSNSPKSLPLKDPDQVKASGTLEQIENAGQEKNHQAPENNNIIDTVASTERSDRNGSQIECFNCDKKMVFDSEEDLLQHITSLHQDSAFKCKLHESLMGLFSGCTGCLYESILRDVHKGKEAEVATIVNADTVKVNENHLDDGEPSKDLAAENGNSVSSKSDKKFLCYDCKNFSTENATEFQNHVLMHRGSKFCCMYHCLEKDKDCQKCCYERSLSQIVGSDAMHETAFGDLACFHCAYVTSRKKLLYYHAVDHTDEAFTCKSHSETKQENCLECVYSDMLKEAQRSELCCDDCGFKTVIIELFDIHKCNKKEPGTFKCGDCEFVGSRIEDLRRHSVCHHKSNFRCTEHTEASSSCSKCTYQKVVESLDDNLIVCEDCSFKTLSSKEFSSHKDNKCGDSSKEGETFKCFHCPYGANTQNLLIYHCKQHYQEMYECDDHSDVPNVECSKCVYQDSLLTAQESLFVCQECDLKTFNGFHYKTHKHCEKEPVLPRIACYECEGNPQFDDQNSLKKHVESKHSKSFFACLIHKEEKETLCGMCFYHTIVKEVLGDNYFTLQCWNCDGDIYTKLKLLEMHAMSQHLDSQFQCQEHSDKISRKCSKCFYARVLRVARAKTKHNIQHFFHCFECGLTHENFEIFERHVGQKHKKGKYECRQHSPRLPAYKTCPECFYLAVKSNMLANIIRCYQCANHSSFIYVSTLMGHLRKHHKGCVFACDQHRGVQFSTNCASCWFETLTKEAYQSRSEMFHCYDCEFNCQRLDKIQAHVRTEHADSKFKCAEHVSKETNCSQCHYSRFLDSARSQPDTYIFTCFKCVIVFPKLVALKRHILVKHIDSTYVCPSHDENLPNCEACWFQDYIKRTLVEHKYLVHCFDCRFKTHDPFQLKKHVVQSHQGSKYTCEEHKNLDADCRMCGYFLLINSTEKSRCRICSEKPHFFERKDLLLHIFTNHKNVAFACKKHAKPQHSCYDCIFKKVAQRAMTFSCRECDFGALGNKDSLQRHVKTHHFKSTFSCRLHKSTQALSTCRNCIYQSVVRKCQSSPGVEIDLSLLECLECSYRCEIVDDLRKHVKEVHPRSTFSCTEHILGEVDDDCEECKFEKVVLSTKEMS